jgi:DNA-binding GntR family transcriptional regulator
VWLKVGPLSNQLFDHNPEAHVLNDAHNTMMKALDQGDAAGVRRAIERDLFVAGQFLRKRCTG